MSQYFTCQILLRGLRSVLKTPQITNNYTIQNGVIGALHVRHKGSKQRIKDAKVQADKGKKFISKKAKKSQFSGSSSVEKSTIIADKPVDNVWIRKFYPPPRFAIEEAVSRHQAFAQPAMLDNMEGLVYLDMLLDFRTKKQTKFMRNIRSTLLLPHPFTWGAPPSILVFCKEEEHANLALSLGAKNAGSPVEIIKMIENGVINPKDFHHVLATADCGADITPARSYFRDKFPQRAKGNLGTDLNAMWNLFYAGYTYESQSLSDAQGKLQVPIGQLKQPIGHLVANFEAYIESVCKHRSVALGPFIQSMSVVAPPSSEEFIVKAEEYVPGYNKNEEFDSDDEEDIVEGRN